MFCFICIFYIFGKMKKSLLDSLRFQQNSNIQRRISHSVKTLKRLKPSVFLVSIHYAWILLICVNVLMKDAALSVNSHYIFYHIILLVFCWLLIAQQILLFTPGPWPLALSTNHSAKCSSANISIGCRLTRRRIQMQHSAKQKSMRQ